jgi:uncharacterized protein
LDTRIIDAGAVAPESRFAAHAVTSVEELYASNGGPRQKNIDKVTSYLTPLLMEYMAASPFCVLATAHRDGSCDVSPRGDPPGSVRVLDARTIVLPDRLGNKRIDSLRNIVTNPHVGMLFIVPAVDEAVRLNGRATVSRDPDLLATMEMQGKTPNLAIIVEIDEVFVHCARAFLRSALWQPERWPDPDTVPTLAAIRAEQKNQPPPDESAGNKRNEDYRTRLY